AGEAGWLVAPALGTALPATAAEMAAAALVLDDPAIPGTALAAALAPALRQEAERWQRDKRAAWALLGVLPG
ncbi:hypothetical protein, partial [Pseudoroseomonas ludipueritiae]